MSYEQDGFDKRFVEVIDLLLYTKDRHKLADNQKILLEKIGFSPINYSMIKKGERGVPKNRRVELVRSLERDFNINPEYVRDGKLPRTFFEHDLLNEDEVVYKTAQQEVMELRAKVADLVEVIKMKNDIIDDLRFLIDSLKKRSMGE